MEDQLKGAGKALQAKRLEKGISLEEISKNTKILPQYLEAIEAEVYEQVPSMLFCKGFIQSYARALGLDPAPYLKLLPEKFQSGSHVSESLEVKQPKGAFQKTSIAQFLKDQVRKYRKQLAVGSLIAVGLGWIIFKKPSFLSPEAPTPQKEAVSASEPEEQRSSETTASPEQDTIPQTIATEDGQRHSVHFVVLEPTKIEVKKDGAKDWETHALADRSFQLPFNEKLSLKILDTTKVRLFYADQEVLLGQSNQPKLIEFQPERSTSVAKKQ